MTAAIPTIPPSTRGKAAKSSPGALNREPSKRNLEQSATAMRPASLSRETVPISLVKYSRTMFQIRTPKLRGFFPVATLTVVVAAAIGNTLRPESRERELAG